MISDAERLKSKLINTLTDSLNQIDSTNFLLSIQDLTIKNGNQPNGKKIIAHFNNIISAFAPDRYLSLLEHDGYRLMPKLDYEDWTVRIELKLLPKAAHRRGKTGRAIGGYGFNSKIGGDEKIIKDGLLQKAKQYGKLDKPFLICLNYPSSFLDEDDINVALYGLGRQNYENDFDGFFGSANNPKNTRVSAVIITGFTVSGLVNAKIHYHQNPYAIKEIADSLSFDLVNSLGLTPAYVTKFSS
jgi:hypothetical protein